MGGRGSRVSRAEGVTVGCAETAPRAALLSAALAVSRWGVAAGTVCFMTTFMTSLVACSFCRADLAADDAARRWLSSLQSRSMSSARAPL